MNVSVLAKRSRQKKPSKAELRREERERERHLKDKLFKEKVLQELERDDTSSTTTESSSLDPDEKVTFLNPLIVISLKITLIQRL